MLKSLSGTAAPLVLAAAAVVLCTAAPSASAATTVISVPGQVAVLGDVLGDGNDDSQFNSLVIKESELDLEDPVLLLSGYVPLAAPLREAERKIEIGIETRALPSAVAEGLNRWLLSLLGMLLFIESDSGDERDRYKTLLVSEFGPNFVEAEWPCRRVRYPEGSPDADKFANAVTVACPLMRSELGGSSDLFVWTGPGNDKINLNLICAVCTRERVVWGGPGNDKISGSPFWDILAGDLGNDVIYGGIGRDFIWGYHQWSSAVPASGTDSDMLFGGVGNDSVMGQWGNDLVSGGESNDVSGPNDVFTGSFSTAALQGGPGADAVIGGPGSDRMQGGPGWDVILAKESDFGTKDIVDQEGNCAGGLDAEPLPGESYRRSEGDSIINCEQELTDFSPGDFLSWRPGSPWPWPTGP